MLPIVPSFEHTNLAEPILVFVNMMIYISFQSIQRAFQYDAVYLFLNVVLVIRDAEDPWLVDLVLLHLSSGLDPARHHYISAGRCAGQDSRPWFRWDRAGVP